MLVGTIRRRLASSTLTSRSILSLRSSVTIKNRFTFASTLSSLSNRNALDAYSKTVTQIVEDVGPATVAINIKSQIGQEGAGSGFSYPLMDIY